MKDSYHNRTLPGYVDTVEGQFPYGEVVTAGFGVVMAPVAVRVLTVDVKAGRIVVPCRNAAGRLLYALPGGGCTQ